MKTESSTLDARPVCLLEAIGGDEWGTTAEMPTLQTVIDYEENRCRLSRGYYRMVDRPALYEQQQRWADTFGVARALAFTSPETALREWVDFWLTREPEQQLTWQLDSPCPAWLQPWIAPPNETRIPRIWVVPDSGSAQRQHWWNSHQPGPKDRVIWIASTLPQERLLGNPQESWVVDLGQNSTPGGLLLGQDPQGMEGLFQLRKRRGPVLSVRNLAAWEMRQVLPANYPEIERQVCRQLSEWEQAKSCFLFPSGMNALVTALELARRRTSSTRPLRFVAIGLLYTDTYSLLMYEQWRGGSGEPIFLNTDELDQLSEILQDDSVAGIVTESITNPLGELPDFPMIQRLAAERRVPLIVDNTLAGPLNAQPLNWGATISVQSTTKYLCGNNQHAGGALLVNDSEWAQAIQDFQEEWQNRMSPWEVLALEPCLQDFPARMQRFNRNGLMVAELLQRHPQVRQVYFNQLPSHPDHALAQQLLRGSGSLMSFVLQADHAEGLARFYDSDLAPIHKAPGLGSNTTMLCPYALLAHYQADAAELRDLRISRYLVRVAVGCEPDLSPVLEALNQALLNSAD